MTTPAISFQKQCAIWRAEQRRANQKERDKKLMVDACIKAICREGCSSKEENNALWVLSTLVHPEAFMWFLKGVEKWRRTLN